MLNDQGSPCETRMQVRPTKGQAKKKLESPSEPRKRPRLTAEAPESTRRSTGGVVPPPRVKSWEPTGILTPEEIDALISKTLSGINKENQRPVDPRKQRTSSNNSPGIAGLKVADGNAAGGDAVSQPQSYSAGYGSAQDSRSDDASHDGSPLGGLSNPSSAADMAASAQKT